MKIIRRGPEQPYRTECPSCDSLLEYTKFDLIVVKKWTGNAWEEEWEEHVGLRCLVCSTKFWNKDTDKMTVVKEAPVLDEPRDNTYDPEG